MQSGDTFQRHYRIDEQLSAGEQGVVYLATHIELGTRRVIKLVDGDPEVAMREGRILARLKSPHTVRVFDLGTTADGDCYLLLEPIDGVPLSQLIAEGEPLDWRRTAQIARQVLTSLAEAHAADLFHGGVRPAHVMVGPEDHTTLIEFGHGGGGSAANAKEDVRAAAQLVEHALGKDLDKSPDRLVSWTRDAQSKPPAATAALLQLEDILADPDARNPPGLRIGGRYDLGEPLAVNHGTTSYAATDTDTDSPVVLVVYRNTPDDAEWAAAFRETARLHMQLRHRNVGRILDYGHMPDGSPFHVEQAAGGSLLAALNRGMTPEVAVRVCRDCATALAEAHRHGFRQRGLTTDRVFLPERPVAVTAMVFGFLETAVEALRPDTEGFLDVRAAAPEVLRGDPPSAQSDLYGLGHLMAETLQGRPFVTSASMAKDFHLHDSPPQVDRSDQIDDTVFDVVDRCLSKDPARRPATSREVRHILTTATERDITSRVVPLDVGDRVNDRYELLAPLGRGAFARVFEAFDHADQRRVAVKLLHSHLLETGEQRRFEREGELVFVRLENPHTLTVLDFGISNRGAFFITTELVEGETLDEVLETRRNLTPQDVVAITIQALFSLQEAHEQQMFHRDIKPSNMMLSPREWRFAGQVYPDCWTTVLDFGIAALYDDLSDLTSLTATGTAPGTPRYAAPEQLFGDPLGPETDIYSLGLVAYELLTGEPAIAGSSTGEVVTNQVSSRSAMLPNDLEISPALRTTFNRMTRKGRSARFTSAHEAIAALTRAAKRE